MSTPEQPQHSDVTSNASSKKTQTGANKTTWSDFIKHIKTLARSPQFYWFLTHVVALWYMLLDTVVSTFKGLNSTKAIKYYNYSVTSIIFTYFIVIRQTYKSKPISFIFSQIPNLLRDDNVQYLLLAVILRIFSNKFYGGISPYTLYPFGIFATFHVLTYFESNLLRYLPGWTKPRQQQVANSIGRFIKNYNERSLFIAANFEVLSIGTFFWPIVKMIIGFQWLRPSYFFQNLKTIVLFAALVIFNKLRYNQNRYTQALVGNYDLKFNQFVYNSPFIPPALKNSLTNLRAALIYYLSFINVPSSSVQKKRS